MNKPICKEDIRDKCIDEEWPLDESQHNKTRNKLAKISSWGVEYKMMDEWAKIQAIEFFKWYFTKQNNFQFYFREVKPITTSQEIEEKILEFEGKPIEELYQLFLKETNTLQQ